MADEPLYYAKNRKVYQRPIRRKLDDGSIAMSMGFPVCTMTDAVGDDAAELVAELMNAGYEAAEEKQKAAQA